MRWQNIRGGGGPLLLKRKVYRQRIKDCSGTANVEKALAWLDTHYKTILDD